MSSVFFRLSAPLSDMLHFDYAITRHLLPTGDEFQWGKHASPLQTN